ncbi:hypothetical protein GNF10_29415 [Nostoc sp. UCD121]|uniref:hypothetical protein n=1 Tax=unclassified Nostoc TaxID=2593658 RepID=UPI001629DF7B|nr:MULTISPECIES: hypothetical protein [unclassified Nostoc]MBC1224991.1 hypothetical protein [Nostoc sp. UCD120]MBC1279957.1 hypothetical protein [Nostoc sp. UCD121]MBC1294623.1 hypothetical protein [Nostoc sp. UCD122]
MGSNDYDLLERSHFNAFTENFLSFILINQISKIYLSEVETDSCILKTANEQQLRDNLGAAQWELTLFGIKSAQSG